MSGEASRFCGKRQTVLAGLIVAVLLPAMPGAASQSAGGTVDPLRSTGDTIVLCERDDPYLPLAEEITAAEGIPLRADVTEALSENAKFLIWVGSPRRIDDRTLSRLGRALAHLREPPAVGIISGRSLESARELWNRRMLVRGSRVYAVNGEYPAARVWSGRISAFTGALVTRFGLSKSNLVDILGDADYLTFTGHGGGSYWSLSDSERLLAGDIPQLPPLVVAAASCQGFRLNQDQSLALAFTSKGAAAYAAFVFSPLEGYLLGEFDGLPFRYTWPDFTIGQVMNLQAGGTLRAFAAFPYYLLLGDPRISLSPAAPYRLERIETDRRSRVLYFAEVPSGVIPLRIGGGSSYSYVEVDGVAAASDSDIFYNSRLQLANLAGDKMILIQQAGGNLTVRLFREPPWHWLVADPLLDALDHTFIYLPGTGGAILMLVAAAAGSAVVLYLGRNRSMGRRTAAVSLLGALIVALAQLLYVRLRFDELTVTTKPLAFDALSLVATGLWTFCGLVTFLRAAAWPTRALGLVLAAMPAIGPLLLGFSAVFAVNTFGARPALGAGIYNYAIAWMPLIGALVNLALLALIAGLAGRMMRKGRMPR